MENLNLNTDELNSFIKAYNKKNEYKIDIETFIDHAKRYIKAIKDNRVICSIGSVSKSGMSRTIKFVELAKNDTSGQHQVLNFYQFFEALGYSPVKNSDYFRIGGCGMDMIFYTNYQIMNDLRRIGLISKDECSTLSQKTPSVI
jgi:hypothetical protein